MNADAQKVGEFRYILDNAERFFYAPSRNASYSGGNALSQAADPNHPATRLAETPPVINEFEPRAVLPRTTLSPITAAIATTSSIAIPGGGGIDGATLTKTGGAIPADGDTDDFSPLSGQATSSGGQNPTWSWDDDPPDAIYASWYTVENGYIIKNEKRAAVTLSPAGADGTTSGDQWSAILSEGKVYANVTHNFYKRFLEADPDVVFLTSTVTDLKNSVRFRDPNITETTVIAPREIPAGTGSPPSAGVGISDLDFENYIRTNVDGNGDTAWEATITAMNTRLGEVRTALTNQGRTGNNNNNAGKGTSIPVTNPNMTTAFATFTSENATLLSNCNKRVREVDARIGIPLYSGGTAAKGNPPSIHVDAIPSSNTTSGLLPYGRSIYNNVNYLLGQDVELLGKITKDIEALDDLIDLVKSDRNKYEIFSGRDKVY